MVHWRAILPALLEQLTRAVNLCSDSINEDDLTLLSLPFQPYMMVEEGLLESDLHAVDMYCDTSEAEDSRVGVRGELR